MSITIKKQIDARGAVCPGPLMELIKVIKQLEQGDIIDLISSDEGSKVDVPKWIEKAGHTLMELKELDGYRHFIVEIGEKKIRKRRGN
ncbi:MAG: sulfurtransferase TusA family protein [Candidatus Heimdallarchaeota archaeon]|nr:sulfurtransferase TusA family protein [Candidatus Heimdallarchaeota archaeon]